MRFYIKKITKACLVFALMLSMIFNEVSIGNIKAEETIDSSGFKAAILSDIHVGFDHGDGKEGTQAKWVKYVLKWYKNQGVNVVILPGDIANGYEGGSLTKDRSVSDFQEFVDVWNEVFPEKKGEDGYVELVMIYGNHDKKLSGGDSKDNLTSEEIQETWKKLNDDDFSPVWSREVYGYQFVGVHESLESANKTLLQEKLDEAVENSNGKPVFYLQHSPMYQTTALSDGSQYGDEKTGYDIAKDYDNVVALTGHTHTPISDERTLWQGDSWEDGKFTSISCGTLNYSGALENGRTNGNGQDTKQGLLMTVEDNDINIERYNFNTDEIKNLVAGTDTEQDFDKCATSAGTDWNFTVGGDKPYVYETRKAESTAPEFADEAVATVSTQSTTATVTFPRAYLYNEDGNECLFESYTVEARDSRNGLIKSTGLINTEYHIDANTELRYSDEYSVTVSGLKEDTKYDFYVYATNFFGKDSQPLKVTGKTTGVRTTGEQGDVNNDYYTDIRDLVALKKNSDSAVNTDVDENGTYDVSSDTDSLYRILLGYATVVVDSEDDLTGQSTYQKMTMDAGCQGYGTQTKVVNSSNENFSDSKRALEMWATARSSSYPYPHISIMFDEAQDWSNCNALNFDTKFVDLTNKKWYEIRIISGEHNRLSNDVNIDASSMDWSTKTIPFKTFTNVDWSNVKGVRFLLNFDYYEGRFDGTTKSQFFVDNMHASYTMLPDNDLLSHYQQSLTAVNGNITKVTGEETQMASMESCEAYKLVSNGDTASINVPLEGNPSRLEKMTVSTKISAGTLEVQAYDKSGNLIGSPVTLKDNNNKWTINNINTSELNYQATVAGYRFTIAGVTEGAYLMLDDYSVTYKVNGQDTDLIAKGTLTSTWFTANMTDWEVQPYTTNGSETAIHAWSDSYDAGDWAQVNITLPQPVDMTDLQYIFYDIRFGSKTKAWSSVKLFDVNGKNSAEFNVDTVAGTDATQWNTMKLNATKVDGSWQEADKTQINMIKICVYIGNGYGNAGYLQDVWIDNLNIILKDTEDLLSADNVSWKANSFGMNNPTNTAMLQIQSEFTNNSPQAVRISTEAVSVANVWPSFVVQLPENGKVNENSVVSVDGYFDSNVHTWLQYDLLDANGTAVATGSIDFRANNAEVHNDWLTKTSNISAWTVKSGKNLSDATQLRITLNLNKYNGVARNMYLDNLVVSNLTTEEEDTDLLSQATNLNVSSGAESMISATKVGSELAHNSSQAYCLNLYSGATGWPLIQFVGPTTYWDMSGYDKLSIDAKLGREAKSMAIKLQYIDDEGEWRVTRWEQTVSFSENEDGWGTGTVNLKDFDKYNSSLGKLSTSELSRIRSVQVLVMLGSTTLSADDTIYIDNLTLVSDN